MNESFKVYVNILEKEQFDQKSTFEHVTVDDILDGVCGVDPTGILSPSQTEGVSQPGSLPGECSNSNQHIFDRELDVGSPTSSSQLSSLNTTDASQQEQNSTKLCGYLKVHKPTDKTKHRRRWFVFSDETCRLMYFRTPKDFIPRCDIDISSASFSLGSSSVGEPNVFEIRYAYVYFLKWLYASGIRFLKKK